VPQWIVRPSPSAAAKISLGVMKGLSEMTDDHFSILNSKFT
jgi:hypothetical protein